MLKKRILASSLASVMALSSVSVVAFADETATADDFGEVVSPAELKEFIKSAEEFAEKELENFGTNQTEQFEDALEAARVVAENTEATEVDVVATYQMLKGVWNNLQNYTLEDLKNLVADYKGVYDKDNDLNEDDKDYKVDTYKTFKRAYEAADDLVADASDDQCEINDTYTALEEAINGLKKYDRVTKSQFRSVYNQYIDLVNSFKNYEDWRRGTATVGGESFVYKNAAKKEKKFSFKDKTITFGELKGIVYGASDDMVYSLEADVAKANTAGYNTLDTDNDTWLKFGMTGTATIADDAKAAYDQFVEKAKYNVTTNVGINTAYNTMKKAIEIFNGWNADEVNRGSRRSCESLLEQYHDDIVKTIAKNSAAKYSTTEIGTAIAAPTKTVTFDVNGDGVKIKKSAAGDTVKEQNATLTIDNDGFLTMTWQTDKWVYAEVAGNNTITVEEGDDLTAYMPIDRTTVAALLDDPAAVKYARPDFEDAYTILEAYQTMEDDDDIATADRDYSKPTANVPNIDTNDTITSKSSKSEAYALVNRVLQYALEDNYPAPDATYTKKDIASLIKDAEKLIDDTGDSAKFLGKNKDLDTFRKAAVEWVAEANAAGKKYEDGKTIAVCYSDAGITGYTYPGKYTGTTTIDADLNSTEVYKLLKEKYDALNDEFKKYPVSFGEIADTIAEIAEGIDNNAYGASTAAIASALEKFARDLSVTEYTAGCEAFDDDRVYMYYNRLETKDGSDGEKALYTDYQALLKMVEEAGTEDPTVVKGDLDDDNVATAKDALMIVQAAVGLITLTDEQKAAADFNNDGKVTSDDALAIVKAALGLN